MEGRTVVVSLSDALDGAHYVRSQEMNGGVTEIYVWHGGHTVNVYTSHDRLGEGQVKPVRSFSVGSVEKNTPDTEVAIQAVDSAADNKTQEI